MHGNIQFDTSWIQRHLGKWKSWHTWLGYVYLKTLLGLVQSVTQSRAKGWKKISYIGHSLDIIFNLIQISYLFILMLLEGQRNKWDLSSIGSHPKCLQRAGLDQAKVRTIPCGWPGFQAFSQQFISHLQEASTEGSVKI